MKKEKKIIEEDTSSEIGTTKIKLNGRDLQNIKGKYNIGP